MTTWSIWRLLLVSACWIAVIAGIKAWWVLRAMKKQVPPELASFAGETVVGISSSLGGILLWLLVLLGPPIVLVLVWFFGRMR